MSCAVAATALLLPLYEQLSPWIGVTVAIEVLTVFHMVFFARTFIPVVHIVLLISGLQYILAPWVAHYYPSDNAYYNIGDQLPEYMAYTGPVVLAFAVGVLTPLIGITRRPVMDLRKWQGDRRVFAELDILILVGIVFVFARRFAGVGFMGVLLANLRYPGVYGWMLLKRKGWAVRLMIVLGVELVLATNRGMFHHLVLWYACTFAIYLFTFRPRPSAVIVILLVTGMLLPSLQHAKWQFRRAYWYGEKSEVLSELDISSANRPVLFTALLADGVVKLFTGGYDREFVADAAVRYNQGWIVNRVLNHVPENEPYARGKTVVDALKAAFLPRVMAPDKYRAGGKEQMLQFANYRLLPGTSMNIGYAGEFYANYGHAGGILACGIYGLLMGLMVRWSYSICLKTSVFWCIWIPFVAEGALKAETGLADAANWVVKSLLVVVVFAMVLPLLHRRFSTRAVRNTAGGTNAAGYPAYGTRGVPARIGDASPRISRP